MQVFQDQQHRVVIAFGLQPFQPRQQCLVSHQARVLPGGTQGQKVLVGEGQVCHLTQKRSCSQGVFGWQEARSVRGEALALHRLGLATGDARGGEQGRAQQGERRSVAHGIAAADQQFEGPAAALDAVAEFVAHARLTSACDAGRQHRAAGRLVADFVP